MWPFTKKKPKQQYITLTLNRYQVQVYNCNHELLGTFIKDGFTPILAIDEARKCLNNIPVDKLLYPITFFTTFKQ